MPNSSPTVRRRRLGLILRDLRANAQLTGEEVARRLERSDSWVSRIETGRSALRTRDLRDLLDTYGVTAQDLRGELETLAREGKRRGWWNRYGSSITGPYASYIGFEAEAAALLCYEALVVNGLLQTEDYARALLRCGLPPESGDDAERKIKVRMTRQEPLSGDNPPQLWVILDESVLRRPFGGAEVMRGQLQHLLDVARERPHISVQVLPLAQSVNPGMIASFTIIEFPPPDQGLVFSEGLTGAIYEEADDVARYTMVFNELRSAALSKADSTALIKKILGEATQHREVQP